MNVDVFALQNGFLFNPRGGKSKADTLADISAREGGSVTQFLSFLYLKVDIKIILFPA